MKVKINDSEHQKCKNCGEYFCTCEEDIAIYNKQLTEKCDICGDPLLLEVHDMCWEIISSHEREEKIKRQASLRQIRRKIRVNLAQRIRDRRRWY